MIIQKMFSFEAAHFLPGEEIYGNCSRVHGHSYKLLVEVKGKVDKDTGMVMNFADLKAIVNTEIVDRLDHRILNDFFKIPTAENMVIDFGGRIALALPKGIKIHAVTLWETATSSARVEF